MKSFCFTALLSVILHAAMAQITTQNIEFGYQEFPTTIHNLATDSRGNTYFTGTYKGQLTVKNQVLATGQGLEDIFWVKTNNAGAVVQHKIFGSTLGDVTLPQTLSVSGHTLVFATASRGTMQYGSFQVMPYACRIFRIW